MTDKAISPLRRRLIEDMAIRRLRLWRTAELGGRRAPAALPPNVCPHGQTEISEARHHICCLNILDGD